MKKKILILCILLLCALALLFLFMKGKTVLLPKAEKGYQIHMSQSLEPSTRLDVNVIKGNNLLLKGRNLWIYSTQSKGRVLPYEDPCYFFDVANQEIYEYDVAGKKKVVSSVDGIELQEEGILITAEGNRIFSVTEKSDYEITFENRSDSLVVFKVNQAMW